MVFISRTSMIVAVLMLLTSCGAKTQLMADRCGPGLMQEPMPGKALIIFLRPSRDFGDSTTALLYDGDRFIGNSTARTYVPYQTEPGKHLFMASDDSRELVDFMEAEFSAGKTYYAIVEYRVDKGLHRYITFAPQNGDIDNRKIQIMLNTFKSIEPTLAGLEYGERMLPIIQELRQKYLPQFEQLGENRTVLKNESGV